LRNPTVVATHGQSTVLAVTTSGLSSARRASRKLAADPLTKPVNSRNPYFGQASYSARCISPSSVLVMISSAVFQID